MGVGSFFTTHIAEVEHLADCVGLLADARLIDIDVPTGIVDLHGGDNQLVVGTAPLYRPNRFR